MSIIVWIVIGGLAGWVAGMIMKTDGSLVKNIVTGIVGALIGGFIMELLRRGRIHRVQPVVVRRRASGLDRADSRDQPVHQPKACLVAKAWVAKGPETLRFRPLSLVPYSFTSIFSTRPTYIVCRSRSGYHPVELRAVDEAGLFEGLDVRLAAHEHERRLFEVRPGLIERRA